MLEQADHGQDQGDAEGRAQGRGRAASATQATVKATNGNGRLDHPAYAAEGLGQLVADELLDVAELGFGWLAAHEVDAVGSNS